MPRWRAQPVFVRFEKCVGTSMCTSIVMTDRGKAHIKPLGSPRAPHPLACEWVGHQLAEWLGLPTLEYGLIELTEIDTFELENEKRDVVGAAGPGPAFATKTVTGINWDGSDDLLEMIHNKNDISRLVVLDTWIRNCDRFRPSTATRGARIKHDNVFLARVAATPGGWMLVAMDFSEAFTCGGELNRHLSDIGLVQDSTVYGLFPAFKRFMVSDVVRAAADKLKTCTMPEVEAMIETIPLQWSVDSATRAAMADFLVRRASFVANHIHASLGEEIGTKNWRPTLFDLQNGGDAK